MNDDNKMKKIAFIHEPSSTGPVGDFSPVTSVFSHYELGNTVSPFLLLDHLGPGTLQPTRLRKGVLEHPHRGFETITFVYKGEIEHRDSTGAGGVIQPGDVQWMTAASGVLHEEVFSEAFSKTGGSFELLQLWVNLPSKDKMNPARYQSLSKAMIPRLNLDNDHDNGSFLRVIAGEHLQQKGPALTHTPLQVIDGYFKAGQSHQFDAKEGETTLIYLRSGRMVFEGEDTLLDAQQMAVLTNQGEQVQLTAVQDTQFLYLSGAPLNEPLYGRGYFVMNTFQEVLQAYEDLKNNQFIDSNETK